MRVRDMVAIGFFSAIGMIGMVTASDSVASEMNQPDLIEERVGHGGSIYSRGGQVSGCNVVVAEQNGGELVEERVGHGGSIYSKRSTAGQTAACDASGATYFYSPSIAH